MKRVYAALLIVFGMIGWGTAPAQAATVNAHACENAHARTHNKHCPHKRFNTLAEYLAWVRSTHTVYVGSTLTGWTR